MKKTFSILIMFLFTLGLSAQKTINDPDVEVRKISPFHSISVSGGIDLYISYGDEALAVSASKPEYRAGINTEVENGVLKISFNKTQLKNVLKGINTHLKGYVSYKTLNSLSATGGCDVEVDGTIKTESLKLNFTGGCDFKGKVEVANLEVKQLGGSDVRISGKATKLDVSAIGGSDFKGYDLNTEICTADATGGSDIEITATKELTANASGGSDISYKGKPELKGIKAKWAGSISGKSK